MTREEETAACFDCLECGHRHEIQFIPPRCPRCGSTRAAVAAPEKKRAEADVQHDRFKLAAERAKGNFR